MMIEMISSMMHFVDIKTLYLTLIGEEPYTCMMIETISSMVDYPCVL